MTDRKITDLPLINSFNGSEYVLGVKDEVSVRLPYSGAARDVGTMSVQNFTGNGTTIAFTLTTAPAGENNTQVYIEGVYQQKDTYSITGTMLIFTTAPDSGYSIEVVTISTLALGEANSAFTSYVQGGTGSVSRNVQDKLREVVSVKDFGADPTASASVNNAAFAAAIAAVATTGQTLYIPAGTYSLSQVFSTTGHLSILGDGDATVLDFTGLTSASSAITVSGSFTQIQNITSASKYGLTVTFASAPSLAIGDVFVIYNPTNSSWSSWRAYYKAGEFCEVTGVSGSNATVSSPLYESYVPANVAVYKMNSPKVSLRNFKVIGNNVLGHIMVSMCNHPLIENVTGYNENNNVVSFDRCYKGSAINLDLYNKGNGGDDYALVLSNSQELKVIGGNYYSRRHAIATGGSDTLCCVPCRNLRMSALTTKNDVNSGVWSADFHGNTENSVYENCQIYNGASWQGKNNRYVNCTITDGLQSWAVYSGEIVGGYHTLENCNLIVGGNPATYTRGIVDIGGNSSPVTSNTTEQTTFVVKNCRVSAPSASAITMLVMFKNNGTTQAINFEIDGVTLTSGSTFGYILYTSNVTGTAASNFISVDNISNFPSGTYLHSSVANAYANFPHRCQRQTGSASITATSGTSFTVAGYTNFKYPYPRTPVATVSTAGNLTVFNGNKPIIPNLYALSATQIRPVISTGDAVNWTNTGSVTFNWVAEIDEA